MISLASSQQKGNISEELVSRILRVYGLTIVARNLHLKFSELDIIAIKGKVLYIIEVRGRKLKSCKDINKNKTLDITKFVDIRKVIRVFYAGLYAFNMYRQNLNIYNLQIYVAIVGWFSNKICSIKFVNLQDLI